jgi:hypothetical protein
MPAVLKDGAAEVPRISGLGTHERRCHVSTDWAPMSRALSPQGCPKVAPRLPPRLPQDWMRAHGQRVLGGPTGSIMTVPQTAALVAWGSHGEIDRHFR